MNKSYINSFGKKIKIFSFKKFLKKLYSDFEILVCIYNIVYY